MRGLIQPNVPSGGLPKVPVGFSATPKNLVSSNFFGGNKTGPGLAFHLKGSTKK